ncbi:MAG: hypothetical protein ACOH1W_02405 [Tessaracoccus sp.]
MANAITEEPEWWLGQRHLQRYGPDAKLLTKLLHAGERLPIHAHPGVNFARTHLGCAHGKAEAWVFLEGAEIYLGWKRDVDRAELSALVLEQRVQQMLDSMHRVEVVAGDTVYVPPTVPHAIGQGGFLIEVQEPETLSVLLEWEGFAVDGRVAGHLGLGYDLALDAVTRQRLDPSKVDGLVRRFDGGIGELLPTDAAAYFRVTGVRVDGRVELERGYSVFIVGEGSVTLGDHTWTKGDAFLTPWSAGSLEFTGAGLLYRCQPPAA